MKDVLASRAESSASVLNWASAAIAGLSLFLGLISLPLAVVGSAWKIGIPLALLALLGGFVAVGLSSFSRTPSKFYRVLAKVARGMTFCLAIVSTVLALWLHLPFGTYWTEFTALVQRELEKQRQTSEQEQDTTRPQPGAELRGSPFEAIDRHALAAPPQAEESIPALAKYLVRDAKNDTEKARAIYRWITDRIAYDVEPFLAFLAAGKPIGDCSDETVLKTRKSVCDGYSNLFVALAKQAGLEVIKISGNAKGYGYVPGEKISTNHAWIAVKIEDHWYLVDATWGAGYLDEKTHTFKKQFDDYYFAIPPEQLIFEHLPENPKWQLLPTPVSEETYRKWPRVDHSLFEIGFSAEQVRAAIRQGGLVEAYSLKGLRIRFIDAPASSTLKAGEPLRVRVEITPAEEVAEVAIIQGEGDEKDFKHLSHNGNTFDGEVTLKPGMCSIGVYRPGAENANKYWSILMYTVK
jgi:transglutaminase-like putative cysteine protease